MGEEFNFGWNRLGILQNHHHKSDEKRKNQLRGVFGLRLGNPTVPLAQIFCDYERPSCTLFLTVSRDWGELVDVKIGLRK